MHSRDSLPFHECIYPAYTASTNVFQMEPFVTASAVEIEYKRGNKKAVLSRSPFSFYSSEIEGLG